MRRRFSVRQCVHSVLSNMPLPLHVSRPTNYLFGTSMALNPIVLVNNQNLKKLEHFQQTFRFDEFHFLVFELKLRNFSWRGNDFPDLQPSWCFRQNYFYDKNYGIQCHGSSKSKNIGPWNMLPYHFLLDGQQIRISCF